MAKTCYLDTQDNEHIPVAENIMHETMAIQNKTMTKGNNLSQKDPNPSNSLPT